MIKFFIGRLNEIFYIIDIINKIVSIYIRSVQSIIGYSIFDYYNENYCINKWIDNIQYINNVYIIVTVTFNE